MNLAQDRSALKTLLEERSPLFWPALTARSLAAETFSDLLALSTLRKRAQKAGFSPNGSAFTRLRIAMIGGYSFHPLRELFLHLLACVGFDTDLFVGGFNSYTQEILDPTSALYQFRPELVVLFPSDAVCRYPGELSDPRSHQEAHAQSVSANLIELCRILHERSVAEVILANFALPSTFDPGVYRTKSMGSDWSFRKLVNIDLGLRAPSFVRLCDLEFLSCRRGTLLSVDRRGWFESKQPGSPGLQVDLAKELVHIIQSRSGPKKVLVLDLDNTLWGGVVGDDGLERIELGDTSPRGEAFKAFQRHVASLAKRGVLLAVSSKNDPERAREPFERHPEMVLKLDDFVAFEASWDPKPDALRRIAAELSLGLDSFVFADDDPAEVEMMRQFVPEVTAVCLGDDAAEFPGKLDALRLFEISALTDEDVVRVRQYREEGARRALLSSIVDMDSYLRSLSMTAEIYPFRPVDVPRITQLIQRSNQFNLTTRRRSEAEVTRLACDPTCRVFSMRLSDRFGDHGLISVIIGRIAGSTFEIDTWLMSCRVLNRQVEDECLNEVMRLARLADCSRVIGVYIPSAKNGMVRDFYSRMGFERTSEAPEQVHYACEVAAFAYASTHIKVQNLPQSGGDGDRKDPRL